MAHLEIQHWISYAASTMMWASQLEGLASLVVHEVYCLTQIEITNGMHLLCVFSNHLMPGCLMDDSASSNALGTPPPAL
jgi:hypothetical protein